MKNLKINLSILWSVYGSLTIPLLVIIFLLYQLYRYNIVAPDECNKTPGHKWVILGVARMGQIGKCELIK